VAWQQWQSDEWGVSVMDGADSEGQFEFRPTIVSTPRRCCCNGHISIAPTQPNPTTTSSHRSILSNLLLLLRSDERYGCHSTFHIEHPNNYLYYSHTRQETR